MCKYTYIAVRAARVRIWTMGKVGVRVWAMGYIYMFRIWSTVWPRVRVNIYCFRCLTFGCGFE